MTLVKLENRYALSCIDKDGESRVIFGKAAEMATLLRKEFHLDYDNIRGIFSPLLKNKANVSYIGLEGIYLYSEMVLHNPMEKLLR